MMKCVVCTAANNVHGDLGCDVAWACRWVPTFRRNVLSQALLTVEAVCSPETLVSTYKSTPRHNPDPVVDISLSCLGMILCVCVLFYRLFVLYLFIDFYS